MVYVKTLTVQSTFGTTVPASHLLNKCPLIGFESDYIVVDFKSIYAVPIDYLLEITRKKGSG